MESNMETPTMDQVFKRRKEKAERLTGLLKSQNISFDEPEDVLDCFTFYFRREEQYKAAIDFLKKGQIETKDSYRKKGADGPAFLECGTTVVFEGVDFLLFHHN